MANPYESDALLHQYLVFHYGSSEEQFPHSFGGKDALHFPARCVQEGLDLNAIAPGAKALDLGCAVGRSTFELARYCEDVIGIDYSAAFISAGQAMQATGKHQAQRLDEGASHTTLDLELAAEIDRSRVHFEVGDAQALRADLGSFDVVLACNLICRLPEPNRLLNRLSELVRPNGQLFITTPFTWLEEYTPRSNWLGTNSVDSFEGLRTALASNFELKQAWDMPFLIRDHARKFQYSIAQASRWQRKA
jgi:putative 4-mercaptohistidine N1-methyltranferase